jgi:fucose 4-O-acetylase-like acetyltransferase
MLDSERHTATAAPILQRLDEIDVAKGIGIILVVLGHIVAVRSEGPEAYAIFKTYLYQFHMPFFMYLSGFAFFRACEKYGDVDIVRYARERAKRLLIPFFAFGLIIIFAKEAAKSLMQVDDAPDQLWTGLSSLFIHTNNSPALSIWYVFVLFCYCVFSFSVKGYKRNRLPTVFILSIVLYCTNIGDFFYANRIFSYYVFFVIGMLISSRYDLFRKYLENNFKLYLTAFALMSICLILLYRSKLIFVNDMNRITMMFASFSAIPFLHSMSMVVRDRGRDLLRFFGKNSFAIYLMNTIAIGVFKAIYVRFFFEMNSVFLLYAVSATAAGLLFPIACSAILRQRAPALSKYMT